MTNDELRIAVCKATGWTDIHDVGSKNTAIYSGNHPHLGERVYLPPLTLDLMHSVESELLKDADLGYRYDMALQELTGVWEECENVMLRMPNIMKAWHATAEQRAIAFLKVRGIHE